MNLKKHLNLAAIIALLISGTVITSHVSITYAQGQISSEERCYGLQDEDGDGAIDCEDSDCKDHQLCKSVPEPVEEEIRVAENPICGDGACHIKIESCAIVDESGKLHSSGKELCEEDCGYCPPRCGNDICEADGGETTRNCAQDCADPSDEIKTSRSYCGNNACAEDEDETSCPADCLPRLYCGDGECSLKETSVSCPNDCKLDAVSLRKRIPGLKEIDALPDTIIFDESIDEQTRAELSQTLADLRSSITTTDPMFVDDLNNQGVILTASLLGEEGALTNAASSIARKLKEEAKKMRMSISEVLLDAAILRRLNLLPNRERLMEAVKDNDLVTVRLNLPPNIYSAEENISRIRLIEDSLLDEIDDNEIGRIVITPIVVAEEVDEETLTAKSGFKHSAFLLKRMEAMGIDPETGERDIAVDIEKLKERKEILAGITGLVDGEEAEEKLDEAVESLNEPTTDSLINVRGIFKYIQSTANFQALDGAYSSAIGRMKTGFGRMRASLSWKQITPQAEAKSLLSEEVIQKLMSNDLEEQKEAMSALFKEQGEDVDSVLDKLSEEERAVYEQRLNEIGDSVDDAENIEDIRTAATTYSITIMEIEEAARSKKGIFKRMIYRLQDFFGRSSNA